jgi:hypothetical protein
MQQDESDIETDGEEIEAEPAVQVNIRNQGGRRGTGKATDPVQSSFHIPIFPELNRDSQHVITQLNITKLTAPGDGFKGTLPPTATLETIGREWGNGRYNIHGITQDGKILRRADNVAISLNAPPQAASRGPSLTPDLQLLTFQANENDKNAARAAGLTEKHLTAIEQQAKAQTERDRAFFAEQARMQQNFLAAILGMQQSAFQQTLAVMEASRQRDAETNNPLLFLSLFREGMNMGRTLESDDDENPFVRGMQVGVNGLDKLANLFALKQGLTPDTVVSKQLPSSTGKPGKKATKAAPGGDVAANAARAATGIDQEVLARFTRLKAKLDEKGVGLKEYLQDALDHVDEDYPEEAQTDESDTGENAPEDGANHGQPEMG